MKRFDAKGGNCKLRTVLVGTEECVLLVTLASASCIAAFAATGLAVVVL